MSNIFVSGVGGHQPEPPQGDRRLPFHARCNLRGADEFRARRQVDRRGRGRLRYRSHTSRLRRRNCGGRDGEAERTRVQRRRRRSGRSWGQH